VGSYQKDSASPLLEKGTRLGFHHREHSWLGWRVEGRFGGWLTPIGSWDTGKVRRIDRKNIIHPPPYYFPHRTARIKKIPRKKWKHYLVSALLNTKIYIEDLEISERFTIKGSRGKVPLGFSWSVGRVGRDHKKARQGKSDKTFYSYSSQQKKISGDAATAG